VVELLKKFSLLLSVFTLVFVLAACGGANRGDNTNSENQSGTKGNEETKLTGTVEIDGSSTVFPFSEAAAETFGAEHRDVRVPVGVSGTGGGFKRFCGGETDITGASRPIKDSEAELCQQNNIEYIELQVAFDGLSVLVHPDNDFVDFLTVEELHEIFKPGSSVKTWADVRAGWPNSDIAIFSPGADSGTFDYFTEVINGEAQASRNDSQVSFSEDDHLLVQGVAGNKNAIAYFGYAYYVENQEMLKVVPIDNGNGPITPSEETINDESYAPLTRPIFEYVKKESLERAEVKAFTRFMLENGGDLALEVGYINLTDEAYENQLAKIK
jgi:phosphate transport system substrate-binding protein